MSNDPVDGGTVAQQIEGQIVAVDFEAQTITLSFAEDARVPLKGDATVTFATPPEPAPLVVTCNGHRIELSDEDAAWIVRSYGEKPPQNAWPDIRTMYALAGLLRDARQDPQPASDENAPGSATPGEQGAGVTCTPAPDTDSDIDFDFDALPIGTVLKTYNGYYVTKGGNGNWFSSEEALAEPDHLLAPYTVVYQPAPLSPGECLRGLLAGRDDADRLLRGAAESWYEGVACPRPIWWSTLRGVIGDAARAVHG